MTIKKKIKDALGKVIKGRPRPSAPRAGYLASGRRYGCGGKVSKKKTV